MKGKCRTAEEKIRYHTAMRPQRSRSGTRRAKDMRDPADDFGGSVNRELSFKETCSILRLSKSGLRRLINKAEITPIRLSGRRIGFRLQDIQDSGGFLTPN